MTPKEKAEQLVMKYFKYTPYAKQCALIAVDEMLMCPQMFDTEQVKYMDGTYAREYYEVPNRYWTKVKNEIEKI